MGFEPISSWLTTRGINPYAIVTPKHFHFYWHSWLDSNQHRSVSKTDALFIKLQEQKLVDVNGIEPLYPVCETGALPLSYTSIKFCLARSIQT